MDQKNINSKKFIIIGAIFSFLSVGLGAFGAHALKTLIDDYSLQIWEKAVYYQTVHALALIILGILQNIYNEINFKLAGYAFITGIFLFSGSLYFLALSQIKILGAITPLGGVSFLLGWGLIIYKLIKKTNN